MAVLATCPSSLVEIAALRRAAKKNKVRSRRSTATEHAIEQPGVEAAARNSRAVAIEQSRWLRPGIPTWTVSRQAWKISCAHALVRLFHKPAPDLDRQTASRDLASGSV